MVKEQYYYYGPDPQTDLTGIHLKPKLNTIVVRIRGRGKHVEQFKKELEDIGMLQE